MSNTPAVDAGVVTAMLGRRFPPPAYAFLADVGDATGANVRRRADGLAVSLWPSRGVDFIGFEVKVSRQDWLNEMRNPRKAEAIGKFCKFWWLAVGDESIVHDGELPSGWGLLAVRGDKLFTIRDAPALEPQPPTVGFVAAVFRRFAEGMVPAGAIAEKVEQERQRLLDEGARASKYRMETAERHLRELAGEVRLFEDASGISIGSWNIGQIGKTVKLLLDHRQFEIIQNFVERAHQQAQQQEARLAEVLAEMQQAAEAMPPQSPLLKETT